MQKKTIAAGILAACVIGPVAFAAGKEKPMNDQQVKELFASTCGFCHQNGGRQAGKGPKLAGTQRNDAFIVNRIKHGKEGAMPAFDGALNDTQIKGIIHYIRHLKSD
jgi:mono/diheme cytochrome c family protein